MLLLTRTPCLFAYIRVITKLPNSEQSSKGKVKTHKYINRQNQSTTGKLVVKKLSELICSGFFLFITTLRTSIQCHIFISVYLDYWSLAYQLFLYVPPPPFSFWNITELWSNTTQIVITHICVIFSWRTMSLSICSMVQLYIKEYSTVGNENIAQT